MSVSVVRNKEQLRYIATLLLTQNYNGKLNENSIFVLVVAFCYLISAYLVYIVKMFPLANAAQSLRPTFRTKDKFSITTKEFFVAKIDCFVFKYLSFCFVRSMNCISMTVFRFSSMFRIFLSLFLVFVDFRIVLASNV